MSAAPVWRVEFTRAADRDLRKLGAEAERTITRYLRERIAGSSDPRRFGHALMGDLKGLWRYRVGDYRIVASIEDNQFVVRWSRSATAARFTGEGGIRGRRSREGNGGAELAHRSLEKWPAEIEGRPGTSKIQGKASR